jgi:DNA-binding response OmpR family regulator
MTEAQRTTIVIVEDNPDLRELVRLTLEFGDYDLFETDTADTGQRLISSIRPDVVLLDVMMPGHMDGFELCRWIKNDPELKHITVIMLSAKGQKVDLQEGEKAGADDYLVKPFSPLKLMSLLKDLDIKPVEHKKAI